MHFTSLKKNIHRVLRPPFTLQFCVTVLLFCGLQSLSGQYTDQINSNRPGMSVGAFAVGKNVVQMETGLAFRSYRHSGYNNSTSEGLLSFLSLRWGFLMEQLELLYEGAFYWDTFTNHLAKAPIVSKRKGFLQNFIGLKFLFYDPFKNGDEANIYSWKANNGFKLKQLLPAISLTSGANLDPLKTRPFSYGDVFNTLYNPLFYQNLGLVTDQETPLSLRTTLATQSHFLGTWVFVTNWNYNRILSDSTEMSYILTLTHTFHPLWSVYVEHQGIYSSAIEDNLFRVGAAYLVNNNIQVEATLGSNTKKTPNQLFVNAGLSYRLDFHKDFISGEEREAKKLKKEERKLKKTMRKSTKKERKRARKAKRN